MTYSRLFERLAGCSSAAILCLGAMSNAALAQGPPPGSGMPANNNPKIESRERELREGQLRHAEREAYSSKENEKRVDAVILQMKEDFTRIQIVRNEIAERLVARKPLDYSLISDQTADVNKRATRLKSYMMAPPDDGQENAEKKSAAVDIKDMTSSLVRLCKLIDAFVENPAIKNAGTIDAQQLEKARADKAKADRDLLTIVELSDGIHKVAERLTKTPQ